MRFGSDSRSRTLQRGAMRHVDRLLMLFVSAVSLSACGSGGGDRDARVDERPQQGSQQAADQATPQQVALPNRLCELLPRADAEKIMGKALVEQRNDDSACHYQDAQGTTGTGLMLDLNAFEVSDQCRLTPGSESLSGVGSEACIAVGRPAGLYTTVVFGGGGRTFQVTAPGRDRASELSTAVARVVLSKLPS